MEIANLKIAIITIFFLSLLNIQNCLSISQDSTKLVTITMPPLPSPYLDILSNNDNNNNSATINPTFSTYENPIYGVKIQYPSNWQKMDFDRHYGNNSLLIKQIVGLILTMEH
jgi:hypothetical protein